MSLAVRQGARQWLRSVSRGAPLAAGPRRCLALAPAVLPARRSKGTGKSAARGAHVKVASFSTTSRRSAKVVKPFILADIGEGIAEVEIVKWLVRPGATVEDFDPILEVQSDKATVEITSPYSGKVTQLFGEVGQVVRVGKALCNIEMEDEEGEAPEVKGDEAQVTKAAEVSDAPHPEGEVVSPEVREEGEGEKRMVHSTPAVRRIAKEHDVDISIVKGTGKDGRVTKEDVLNFLSSKDAPSAPQPGTATSEVQRVPLSSIRKAMHRSMTASLQIPHFAYSEDMDLTELERTRVSLNTDVPLQFRKTLSPEQEETLEALGQARVDVEARFDRVTTLSLMVKALGAALQEFPLFRSTLSGSDLHFSQRGTCDISIALSTPWGLFTPLVPSVERMTVYEVASWIARLQSVAKATTKGSAPKFPGPGRTGTITLSNIGTIGGSNTHPVIPPTGQLAIGAIGRSQVLPRFRSSDLAAAKAAALGSPGGSPPFVVEPRLITNASFTADHRVVEGVELARLVARWKELLETPAKLLGLGR